MGEDEERKLLEAVRRASEESRAAAEEARAAMARSRAAREDRSAAVQAAMDAGVPRARIAEAAGTHRNTLYRLLGKTTR